MFSTEDPYKQD